jgi:threonine dehydrogenase-like Zn-dependent dehydrogenase
LAGLKPGDSVVIYGCGPVGLMAAHSAMIKGASKVIVVDRHPDRLGLAEPNLPGSYRTNFLSTTLPMLTVTSTVARKAGRKSSCIHRGGKPDPAVTPRAKQNRKGNSPMRNEFQ